MQTLIYGMRCFSVKG